MNPKNIKHNASNNPKPPNTTLNKDREAKSSITPHTIVKIEFLIPLFISLFNICCAIK